MILSSGRGEGLKTFASGLSRVKKESKLTFLGKPSSLGAGGVPSESDSDINGAGDASELAGFSVVYNWLVLRGVAFFKMNVLIIIISICKWAFIDSKSIIVILNICTLILSGYFR